MKTNMFSQIRPGYNLFKIDLIVWKLTQHDTYLEVILVFKIDLIVWKPDTSGGLSTRYQKFKIDLIVWKL